VDGYYLILRDQDIGPVPIVVIGVRVGHSATPREGVTFHHQVADLAIQRINVERFLPRFADRLPEQGFGALLQHRHPLGDLTGGNAVLGRQFRVAPVAAQGGKSDFRLEGRGVSVLVSDPVSPPITARSRLRSERPGPGP